MKRTLLLAAIAAVLVVLLLLSPTLRELMFGWIGYLRRVLPAVRADWASIGLGVAATLLFAGVLHAVLRSVRGGWSIRGTLAAVGLIYVAFAAGIALVGITHQTIWLASFDRPMFEQRVSQSISRERKVSDLATGLNDYRASFRRYPTLDAKPSLGMSWEAAILEHTQPAYWPTFREQLAWYSPNREEPGQKSRFGGGRFDLVFPQFIAPDAPADTLRDAKGRGLSHYSANIHVLGPHRGKVVIDNPSQTILIGEINANFVPWGDPANFRDPAIGINTSPHGFGGPTGSNGAYFGMADGSARFIADHVSPEVLQSLCGPVNK
jgi:hypothetical protein